MSKRVGDMGTTVNLAILVGLGVGGYVLYEYLDPNKQSPTGNSVTSASVAPDLQSQVAEGNGPNYDATQYSSWADEIYSAASHYGTAFSDSASVLAIMDQIDNLADMYSLIQAFGTRNFSWWVSSGSYSLPGFIQACFSSGAVASFNQQLGYNNVAFSF
jgi:hypothetical protein